MQNISKQGSAIQKLNYWTFSNTECVCANSKGALLLDNEDDEDNKDNEEKEDNEDNEDNEGYRDNEDSEENDNSEDYKDNEDNDIKKTPWMNWIILS